MNDIEDNLLQLYVPAPYIPVISFKSSAAAVSIGFGGKELRELSCSFWLNVSVIHTIPPFYAVTLRGSYPTATTLRIILREQACPCHNVYNKHRRRHRVRLRDGQSTIRDYRHVSRAPSFLRLVN